MSEQHSAESGAGQGGDFDALCAEIEQRPGAAERIDADVRSMTAGRAQVRESRVTPSGSREAS